MFQMAPNGSSFIKEEHSEEPANEAKEPVDSTQNEPVNEKNLENVENEVWRADEWAIEVAKNVRIGVETIVNLGKIVDNR